jgi:hypothetical protein
MNAGGSRAGRARKKHFGVYDDFGQEHFSVYAINDNSLTNEGRAGRAVRRHGRQFPSDAAAA